MRLAWARSESRGTFQMVRGPIQFKNEQRTVFSVTPAEGLLWAYTAGEAGEKL